MPDFELVAPFQPTGDQPAAIDRLTDGLANGLQHQVLLGATGTGKTATLAWTIASTMMKSGNRTSANSTRLCPRSEGRRRGRIRGRSSPVGVGVTIGPDRDASV